MTEVHSPSPNIDQSDLPILPADWQWAQFKETCHRVSVGHVGPTTEFFTDEPDGIRFLRSQNVRPGKLEFENALSITPNFHKKLKKSQLIEGDILIVRVGANRGDCCVVPSGMGELNCANIVFARPKDPNGFHAYFFQSDLGRELLLSASVGAAQGVINTGSVATMPVPCPPLNVQRRIGGILSAYDELIENNQQRIKILEAMARVLYRETIETGKKTSTPEPIINSHYWRFISENVSRYVGTKRYYATADIDGLAVTGPGIEFTFPKKPSRAQKQPIPNSVWFARMKDTYKIAWFKPADDKSCSGFMLSSGFAGFQTHDADFWPLLFLTVTSEEFHEQKNLYCSGATQMSLTNEGLARITMPIPSEDKARLLGKQTTPMLIKIATLQEANAILRRTRDLLLSRLLSGQIDVEAAV